MTARNQQPHGQARPSHVDGFENGLGARTGLGTHRHMAAEHSHSASRRRLGTRAVALASAALALFALSGPSRAQGGTPSNPHALFVPGDEVPLSQFVAGSSGTPATLNVRPAILEWLVTHSHPIQVAEYDGSTVTKVAAATYNVPAGTVTHTPSADAALVVVSSVLVNDFPIVTHWNSSLNARGGVGGLPRGGQQLGASDGIATLDYDPVSGTTTSSGDSWLNGNAGHAHATGGKYYFATDKYALFSDGTETTPFRDGEPADQLVPDYERYVEENYSSTAITDLHAVWMSDHIRELTNLPVAHRNHPTAFDTGAPATSQIQEGLPLFQIVHCYVVPYDDPAVTGAENSLATFVLPPFWNDNPEVDYPVLFNSFYGIHGTTFSSTGAGFIKALGELYTLDGHRAVGIFHNGGGATPAQSLQGSGVHNVRMLFDFAETNLSVDVDSVVVTGGSRGGSSGLHYSSNPDPLTNGFTAQYVICENPEAYVGDLLDRFVNPSYGLVTTGVSSSTGYRKSWKDGWVDPNTARTGAEQAAYVLTGTDNFATIDATLSNGSSPFITQLAAEGCRVVLRLGTHDCTKPFLHMTELIEAMVGAGVPLRVELGHRLGHAYPTGLAIDERELLNRVIDQNLTLATGLFHYRPLSEQDELDFVGNAFSPAHAPVLLESPHLVALGQDHTHVITGPPGADYQIWTAQIDETEWLAKVNPASDVTTPMMLFSGTLPLATGGVSMTSAVHTYAMPPGPSNVNGGPWRLEVRYRLFGASTWTVLTGRKASGGVHGETSAPEGSYDAGTHGVTETYDLVPVMYQIIPTTSPQVNGLDLDGRTGGLDEDSSL